MEVNEEEIIMMMRKGKHPFSSRPCSEEGEQGGGDVVVSAEREHMFDKVVTPSDVGKLNRLVIPKQHAERYFPMDSASHDKGGLLLCFEDLSGKPWSFRYSYWNSSQSYVMTKGWSRFVKDKKLDAGDVVSFHRAASRDKLFIDWRRRHDHPPPPSSLYHHHHFQYLSPVPTSNYSLFMPPPPPPILHMDSHLYWPNHPLGGYPNNKNSVIYMRPAAGGPQWQQQGGSSSDPMVYESVPAAAHKRLRLFGVNVDIFPINAHHHFEDKSNSNPHSQCNGTPASSSSLVSKGKSSSSSMSLDLEFSGNS